MKKFHFMIYISLKMGLLLYDFFIDKVTAS